MATARCRRKARCVYARLYTQGRSALYRMYRQRAGFMLQNLCTFGRLIPRQILNLFQISISFTYIRRTEVAHDTQVFRLLQANTACCRIVPRIIANSCQPVATHEGLKVLLCGHPFTMKPLSIALSSHSTLLQRTFVTKCHKMSSCFALW